MLLLCVALMLRERGVRVRFLGADIPIPAVLSTARRTGADAVVLAATRWACARQREAWWQSVLLHAQRASACSMHVRCSVPGGRTAT